MTNDALLPEQSDSELHRFAQRLIRLVRDQAIQDSDRLVAGDISEPDPAQVEALRATASVRSAVEALIPEIVDFALFELLNAVDNGELDLAWRSSEGTYVSLANLGHREMAGWLMDSPGWRHAFSTQRFSDPNKDLRLKLP